MRSKVPHVNAAPVMSFFFIVGLLSACAFRLIIVFHRTAPAMVRPVWYAGISGYVLFFFYRYEVTRKRKKAVREHCLIDKISEGRSLSEEDRMTVLYLLASVTRSKEDINYLVIFVLSILAVMMDLFLSLKGV